MKNNQYFFARVLADTNLYKVELGNNEFHYGKEVIINTEFGEDIAVISSFIFEEAGQKKMFNSGNLIRYATAKDREALKLIESRSQEVKSIVSSCVTDLKLGMNITHILLPLYGKTVVVYYVARGRVDFRQLLINLRSQIKEKVVMRQISASDRETSFAIDSRIPANKTYSSHSQSTLA